MSQSFRSQSFMLKAEKTTYTPTVIISTALMLISGTMNTVAFAYQGEVYGYKHGFIQTAFMFIGEYIN